MRVQPQQKPATNESDNRTHDRKRIEDAYITSMDWIETYRDNGDFDNKYQLLVLRRNFVSDLICLNF